MLLGAMLFLCRPHVCDEMKTRSSRDWQGPLQCSRWLQCTLESPAFSLSIKVRHSQPSLTSIPAERFQAACGCSCSTFPTRILSSGPLDPLIPHVSALPVLALASLITSAPHFPRAPQKYSGFHKISSNRDTTDSWVSVSGLTASIDLSPRTLRDHPWPLVLGQHQDSLLEQRFSNFLPPKWVPSLPEIPVSVTWLRGSNTAFLS